MRTQIDRENAGFNTTNFLKWVMQNPDKESNYLKCKLKEIVIEVNEDDIIALIGNNNNEIFLNYFEYEDISDFISMDELIENNILEEPLFVVIAECAYEWEYGTNTRITGITDDYVLAQTIAKNTNGNEKNSNDLKIATQQRWQFIHDYANFLHGFLWDHMQELTPDDLSLLDLVPYIVWNKMTEKSHIVVETIQKIHNGR